MCNSHLIEHVSKISISRFGFGANLRLATTIKYKLLLRRISKTVNAKKEKDNERTAVYRITVNYDRRNHF